ncbi:phage tail tape measure protein [Ruminococcus sp.]|uniref:phage tail tape measure protein n=1 Tax=Ruminococcus sp. TaxID=41978 RepID=UPI0025E49470|nr:phage tail tape measure protein [Ruminococcus sp.]
MANRIKGITVEINGDTTRLSKALESVNKNIRTTQTQLKDVEKLLKLDPSNTELLSQKQKLLADAVSSTKEKLETLKTAAEQANTSLANGEISQEQYDALQREIIETEQELRNLQTEADKTNTAFAKIGAAGEVMQNVGDKISGAGEKLLPITAGITALGTVAVKTGADFDAAMSKVAAVSGATGDDLQALRDKAREMGSQTKFSASEAAEAMNYMAMAGWKTGDMLSGIEGIMNLAAASGEDLATTSDIVTDALTAFGLTAADSAHFADVLAAASSNANTNVSMMGETFKYAAPVAGSLGFSVEDTAEAIGLMANAGIKSTQAGTSLRSIMTALAGEVKFCGESIGEVEIQTTNADGSMRELSDILDDCRVAFAGLSESEQASAAQALVGKNAMSGFLALMNAAPADIDKLSGAISDCDGTSLSMAETMQDNLAGQLTILKSQLEELAISFSDILMPAIRSIVSHIQGLVDKLNQLDPQIKETIVKIALVAAALGPLLIVIGKTISGIGSVLSLVSKAPAAIGAVKGGITAVTGALGVSMGTILAVVAAIAALVAAFMHLWKTNENFKNNILGIWEQIKSTFSSLTQGITDRINALGFNFESFTDMLKAAWNALCNLLAPVFEGVFQNIANIFSEISGIILGLLDVFIGLFTGNWDQLWNGVKGIFTSIWNFIVSTFTNILNTLKGIADVVLGWFGTSWNEVWTSIKDFFVNIWTSISTFFTGIVTGIRDFFVNIWTGIYTFFSNIFNAIYTVVSTVFQTIYNTIMTVWNSIYETIAPLLDAFKYLFETIFQAIQILIGMAMDWISEKISAIWNAIVSFLTPILEGIKNTFTTIWNAIKSVIDTVLGAIQSVITSVWNAIYGFLSPILNSIKSVVSSVWDSISSKISSIMNTIKSTISNIWDSIKSAVSTKVSGVKTAIQDGFQAAVDWIKGLASDAWNWGADIISGIIDGIKSMISNLADTVTGVADTIRDFLHFSVPDKGPLTDYESWMPDFMKGLADGINKSKKYVEKAVCGVAQAMQLTMDSDLNYSLNGISGAVVGGSSGGTVNNYYNNDNSRTVNQTNNSPKTLSRLEIYRMTRNALNT